MDTQYHNNMKTIYTFGTSFTAGGGFEWGSNDENRNNLLKEFYGKIEIPKTQFDFSWPGHLSRLLDNKIKFINHAKNGYGNERLYRKVWEVVTDKNFDKDESLLILEFSWMMRKEFYHNEIDDYVIANYCFLPNEETNDERVAYVNLANTYWYEDLETNITIQKDKELFFDFMFRTHNPKDVQQKIERNIIFLLSYLESKNINYYIICWPPLKYENFIHLNIDDKMMSFKYNDVEEDLLEFFIHRAKLSISDETNGEYDDFHAGYFGNKIIAAQIYNKIRNSIDVNLKEIDINSLQTPLDSIKSI